jgi:hypothetical protein
MISWETPLGEKLHTQKATKKITIHFQSCSLNRSKEQQALSFLAYIMHVKVFVDKILGA